MEMRTRIRLAEILINETENLGLAEDLLSKGVHFPLTEFFIINEIDITNTKGFIENVLWY